MTLTRTIVETALVLVAGAALATVGGATGVVGPTAVDAPLQSASAPRCVVVSTPGAQVSVGAASPPAGCTVVSAGGAVPGLPGGGTVGGGSAPAPCVDIRTPRSSVTVGSRSAPAGCVVIRSGRVGDRSAPAGVARPPVGVASPPRCVEVTTPRASVRTC